jgi:hypothetical protein
MRKQPSVITKLFVTASVLLHSWYFRFHIRDTWTLAFSKRKTSSYNPYPLASEVTYEFYHILDESKNDDPAVMLAKFVWLNWPLMIYVGQGSNEWVALLVSAFLSLYLPVEELAGSQFPVWKDPLAEMLYNF